MTLKFTRLTLSTALAVSLAALTGCHTTGSCRDGQCYEDSCNTCDASCRRGRGGRCKNGCCFDPCAIDGAVVCCLTKRSNAIPDRYPVGSVMKAHFHAMQTNGEAADFIIHRHEFVGETAELTPDGKDHILEIGARMRSAPFPVLVERSEDNANPELDAERRYIVASVLGTLGNADADQRTIVSPAYGQGLREVEGELDYYRYIYSRGGNGINNGFNNGNFGNNGFGGGGFGFGR